MRMTQNIRGFSKIYPKNKSYNSTRLSSSTNSLMYIIFICLWNIYLDCSTYSYHAFHVYETSTKVPISYLFPFLNYPIQFFFKKSCNSMCENLTLSLRVYTFSFKYFSYQDFF